MILSKVQHAGPRRNAQARVPDSRATSAGALELIRRLCETLNRQAISYAHWKSNIHLDQALAGVDDLDLLVSRHDACAFQQVLDGFGFREVVDRPSRQVPGIRHFYGLDEATGRWVHVHAHFQLVLGHDATKNFHLPLEAPMLASADRTTLLPVPAPEFELILYTIRMVLKFDVVRNPLARFDRTGRHPELEYLEKRSDPSEVRRVLAEHLPCCSRALFEACLAAVRPGASNLARWAVRRQLYTALRAHARRPRLVDATLKFRRYLATSLRVAFGRPKPRKRLANGGAVIAIVGGDGAGKTSVVQHLAEHYRAFVATKTFHLGKPRRSLISHVVRALHQANNGIRRRFAIRHDRKRTSGPQTAGLLLTLKHLCTGRDRYRNYGRACRFATEGGIAICDRWPLPGLKLMDAPKPLDALGFPAVNGFAGLLRAKECEFHEKILRPDVLIVLRLHPDLAVARRTDEREDHVRPRSQEVWEFDWTRLNAHVTDSSQPLPDVVSQVIALSWKAL